MPICVMVTFVCWGGGQGLCLNWQVEKGSEGRSKQLIRCQGLLAIRESVQP